MSNTNNEQYLRELRAEVRRLTMDINSKDNALDRAKKEKEQLSVILKEVAFTLDSIATKLRSI